MDVFVFPSLYEGMPNTVIEAQANGLSCIISDTITREAMLLESTCQLPINDPAVWAYAIGQNERKRCLKATEVLESKGYDIKSVTQNFIEVCLGEYNVKN